MGAYSGMLTSVIEKLGGVDNIASVTHCATRLRFALKDKSKADMDAIDGIDGVLGTQVSAGTHQVLIGTHVGGCSAPSRPVHACSFVLPVRLRSAYHHGVRPD